MFKLLVLNFKFWFFIFFIFVLYFGRFIVVSLLQVVFGLGKKSGIFLFNIGEKLYVFMRNWYLWMERSC